LEAVTSALSIDRVSETIADVVSTTTVSTATAVVSATSEEAAVSGFEQEVKKMAKMARAKVKLCFIFVFVGANLILSIA